MFKRENTFQISLLAAAICSTTPLSHAQDFALEEIVVTAQKRAQSLQDVAVTVSAVSESALQNSGIESVSDLQAIVPNLNITNSNTPAQTGILIRGAGTGNSDPTLEPSVGIFVDGVFMPRSVFGLNDLVDVQQIEILAGPQGTLYGKNTNAGVISITTKKPSDIFEANLEQTLGNYDLTDTKLSLSGPITDNLNYRFTTVQRRRDGFIKSEYDDQEHSQEDRQSYRMMFEWTPSDELTVRPTIYYSLQDSYTGTDSSYLDPNGPLGQAVQVLNGGRAENTDSDDFKISQDQPVDSRLEVKGASVQADYELGDMTLTSITGYQKWRMVSANDYDATSIDVGVTTDRIKEESIAQEFRLTSPGGETIDWVAGLFYFTSNLQRGDAEKEFLSINDGYAPFAAAYAAWNAAPASCPAAPYCDAAAIYAAVTPGSGFNWESNHDSESIALYGQMIYNLSDNTAINAGIRFNHEEKDFDYFTQANPSGVTGIIPTDILLNTVTTNASDSGDLSESDVSGMLSINHFIGDTMIYASISTGSKSGGFNGTFTPLSVEDREYDTEKTLNYEIGAKIDGLLDGRARVNLSYFYTDYTDFQAAYFDTLASAFVVENAGSQVTQGLDFEGMLAVNEQLTLTARLSYLNAMYREYEDTTCDPNSKFATDAAGSCDLSGTRMPFAPEWSGSFAADYIHPVNSGEIYVHGNMTFKSDHTASPIYMDSAKDISYEVFNLRAGYRNDNWDIGIWGKNITDEAYTTHDRGHSSAAQLATGASATDRSYIRALGSSATYGLTVRYNYM